MKCGLRRRTGLAWLGAGLLAPWATRVTAAPARGEAVAWPEGIRLLDGQPWTPRAGARKIIVFWSTSCPYCRRHNRHVQALQAQLAGRPLQLLTVAREHDADTVRRHLAREALTLPVTLDHARLAPALSERVFVPLTVTVGADDRLEWVIPGEMTAEDVMALADAPRPRPAPSTKGDSK